MSQLQIIEGLPAIPARPTDGHKGTFGTVMVVGGSATDRYMLGGPCFAAMGALRAGCGLAVLAVPEGLLTAALGIVPEATGFALSCTDEGALQANAGAQLTEILQEAKPHALVVGPGLGFSQGVGDLARVAAALDTMPRVFDADQLNTMARQEITSVRGPVILTPHPGEWNTLARAMGIEGDPIDDATRPDAAAALARALDAGGGPVVVVLKGARTVVSDGERVWRSDAAESVLAVGGSGDVLGGVIGGLLAQWHPRNGEAARSDRRDAFELACLGVAIHARAGALWAAKHGQAGMLARELATEIATARHEHTGC